MKISKLIILIVLCYQIPQSKLYAQLVNIDSCLTALKTSKNDTNKVILLEKIAWNIAYTNLKQGLDYSIQSYDLAKKLKFERYYARICNTQASIYNDMAEIPKALDVLIEGLKYAKKYNLIPNEAAIYNSFGNVYDNQKQYRNALSYYFQCIEICKKDEKILAPKIVCLNIAIIYSELNKLDSALYYGNLSLRYNLKENNKNWLANNYIVLAEIHYALKNKELCLKMAKEGLKLSKELNDDFTKSNSYIVYANALQLNNDLKGAIIALNEAKVFATRCFDISALESSSNYLTKYYEELGDYKNSLAALKDYNIYKDSSLNNESIKQIKNAEAKYQNEKKQKEIVELNEKNKIQQLASEKNKVLLYSFIGGSLALLVIALILFNRNKLKQKANKNLESFNKQINLQKEIVELKNKEITDSILYAQRIQQSILTNENYFKNHTTDYLILFKPKDIVSGDFYWAINHNEKLIVMNADCTGHGVPGAMMSMMGINFLNEIIIEKNIEKPADILNQLRADIIKALNPEGILDERKDGMDCTLLSIDFKALKLTYSSANSNFYLIRGNELIISKTNKIPVGVGHGALKNFEEWTIDLQKNDIIISLTDGYADQFGGPNGKKFKYNQLENLLLSNKDSPLSELKEILNNKLENWRGNLEQVDDICIIGIKI